MTASHASQDVYPGFGEHGAMLHTTAHEAVQLRRRQPGALGCCARASGGAAQIDAFGPTTHPGQLLMGVSWRRNCS